MSACLRHSFIPRRDSRTQAGENRHLPYQSCKELDDTNMTVKVRSNNSRKNGGKSAYRHVPHSQKPPQVVARRNARERRRVQAVNNAFLRLRKHVPYQSKQKRLSKVKTLRTAIDYIKQLQNMLVTYDRRMGFGEFQEKMTSSSEVLGNVANRPKVSFAWEMDKAQQTPSVGYTTQVQTALRDSLPEYGSLGMNEITHLPNL